MTDFLWNAPKLRRINGWRERCMNGEIPDKTNTDISWFYCASLYCTSQILHFFPNWRFVATLHWASLLAPFFQQHLHILCLCHILVILSIFQIFHYYYICYSDLWSVNFVTTITVLGHHKSHSHMMVNLINVCVLTAPLTGDSLISLSSGLLIPWDTMRLKLG